MCHQKDGRETNHTMRNTPQPSKLCLQAKQKWKQPICELCRVNYGDVLTTEVLGLIWSHQLTLGTNCSPLQFSSLPSQSLPGTGGTSCCISLLADGKLEKKFAYANQSLAPATGELIHWQSPSVSAYLTKAVNTHRGLWTQRHCCSSVFLLKLQSLWCPVS